MCYFVGEKNQWRLFSLTTMHVGHLNANLKRPKLLANSRREGCVKPQKLMLNSGLQARPPAEKNFPFFKTI
jgi:hypothetical protein